MIELDSIADKTITEMAELRIKIDGKPDFGMGGIHESCWDEKLSELKAQLKTHVERNMLDRLIVERIE